MKKISAMLLPELWSLAVETQRHDELWSILENCKDDPITIHNLATNPITCLDNELMEELFKKGDIRTKKLIARYTSNEGIIEQAAHSNERDLRAVVALNQNAKLPVLVWLSKDPWWGVRRKLLMNTVESSGLPIPDYSKLPLVELRERAVETECLEELWSILENCKGDAHTIQKIIENPYASDPQLICRAYDEGDNRVKSTLARDTAVEYVIELAIHSDNRALRSAVALNPYIGQNSLNRLLHDPLWCVRVSALSNTNTTRGMVLDMAHNDVNPNVRNLAYEVLKKFK